MLKSLMGKSDDSKLVLAAMDKSLAIIEFDLTGKILEANANFCSALGYDRSEILGKHHSMFVEPDYARSSDYQDFWAKLRRGEYDAREYLRIGKGGKEIWIQASYNPIFDNSGKPYKVVKFAYDITSAKLKSAEDEGKINAISRAQAVIEFDLQGNILTANDNFCSTLGYSLSEIKGRHHSMFVEPGYASSGDYKAFWDKLRSGEYIAEEFLRIGKGGRQVWIQASYNPILDSKGRVMKVVKFATDVTDRVHAVKEIGEGLQKLAEGDLEQRIEKPFIPSLDKLRIDFNNALEQLATTISGINGSAGQINSGSEEIRSAADDLSKRAEQQAAAVEETAAAVEEITSAVKSAATRAEEAGQLVSRTRNNAEQSGEVVRQAVEAMDRIKKSSEDISRIIGVIDEIAFQTNLLALNAGVEAARAGDAGKGFAVVAQEVRELAQRSANAAKEIKQLITTSGDEVNTGVSLVSETGQALEGIVAEVQEIAQNVGSIVESAREQSDGLQEISTSVTSIDQGTQQNASMAEQLTASSHSLGDEVVSINSMLQKFRTGLRASLSNAGSRSDNVKPHPSMARNLNRKVASAFNGNAAVETDSWKEF